MLLRQVRNEEFKLKLKKKWSLISNNFSKNVISTDNREMPHL